MAPPATSSSTGLRWLAREGAESQAMLAMAALASCAMRGRGLARSTSSSSVSALPPALLLLLLLLLPPSTCSLWWGTLGGTQAMGAPACAALAFPSLGSWYSTFFTPRADAAELARSLLDSYVQAALAGPGARASRALAAFLRELARPDWPLATGAIDLRRHDPPHASSATEWWYFNTHFADGAGNEYSVFAAFFRVIKHTDPATGARSYAHALNWAISDVKNKRYVHESVLDRDSPAVVKKQLDAGIVKDPRLKKAYMEILDRGNVPLPDRMFAREPSVRLDELALACYAEAQAHMHARTRTHAHIYV
jgi:hypothetical protein